jgi:SNF2 family DNA or RNA helicase
VNEFDTWGHFNVSVYAGSNREKAIDEVFNGSSFILIAGKALFTRDSDFINFTRIEWKLVFVDEFHEFKNHKSRAFLCLKQLRDDFECPIVGMTGTLMQNNHDELFTLIDLVRPGLLEDRRSFLEYTSKPIKLARTKDAKDEMRRLGKQREEELLRTISTAYLERKKEVVLKDSLTRKNEKVIFCELSELQKKLYRHLLSLPDFYMLRMANAPCGACNINQQYFIGYKR